MMTARPRRPFSPARSQPSRPRIAAGDAPHPPRQKWSFAGPFGKYDRGAACSAASRSIARSARSVTASTLLSFRNLGEPGGPASAGAGRSDRRRIQGPGRPERPGRDVRADPAAPADRFPPPFPNDQAARARQRRRVPPDLSVIAKARSYERGFPWFIFDIFTQYQEQGADYIAALLTGYEEPPRGRQAAAAPYYNKYFPGHAIAHAAAALRRPGHLRPTARRRRLAQYSKDVTAFLMWAAEPHLEARKRIGFQVMIFLVVLSGLLYFTKKKVWARSRALGGALRRIRKASEGPFRHEGPCRGSFALCMRSANGMTKAVLGIIGGSGIYDLPGLGNVREEHDRHRRGASRPAPLRIGEIAGLPVVFLPRHDKGHRLSPSDINYRANIDALKRAGVTDLISLSACGSFKEELPPGTFVLVDQFVDRTHKRESSFFGKGCVAHVSMAHPVSPRLRIHLAAAAEAEGIQAVRGGTYVCMEGPQFSTLAESLTYKQLGYSVIGMTNMPEAKLAREAEICYATVAMVTDFDCWHPDHDAVTVQDIIKVLTAQCREGASAWWRGLPRIFRASTSRARSAPTARSTPRSSPRRRRAIRRCSKKLDAVAGRVLKC